MNYRFIPHTPSIQGSIFALVVSCLFSLSLSAQSYTWQEPHAKVLPNGGLEWAPTPFEFVAGDTVRYIDFENGDDANDGTSPESAWKHHPWDANAGGQVAAAEDSAAVTYVFKGGVEYRGALKAEGVSGEEGNPIRLTTDPSWGQGPAVLIGSENIGGSGWQKATAENSPTGLPEGGQVWTKDIGEKDRPWAMWLVAGDGEVTRLNIARTPNWKIESYEDVKSQWFMWKDGKMERQGAKGIDPENLTQDPEYYKDALIRSEWGFVMSTPVAVPVTGFDPKEKSLTFEGFFTPRFGGRAAQIEKGMRYFLLNKPHYLDSAGEWYFAGKGPLAGRVYLWLPDGQDPNEARVEAARHKVLVDLVDVDNVTISGLKFSFTNLAEFGMPGFSIYEDEHEIACIRMQGNVTNVAVTHNQFIYSNSGFMVDVDQSGTVGENILFADNEISEQDYFAFKQDMSFSQHAEHPRTKEGPASRVNNLRVLRNKITNTGFNPTRGDHGHTVVLKFPETAEVAGNILDRPWGSGIWVFGGKGSGDATHYRPLSRILIHHNQVTNSLVSTNDWGGIETWQGGAYYVFNNVSGNPGGYRHWRWLRQKDADEDRLGHVGTRFGHAYYMDGSFKNYHFNNIAWGQENDLRSPLMNTAAFQEIHGFLNNAYNNTVYMFGAGSRRQTPEPGRNLYLGNVWSHISDYVFAHGPIEGVREVNAADVGEVGEEREYATVGYANNVFYQIDRHLSNLAANDGEKVPAMAEALKEVGAYAGEVGVMAEQAPLADPENKDFRPSDGSPAIDYGVKPFVPWMLYATVGEWNFLRNNVDPTVMIDDHWFMTPLHADRTMYEDLPRWHFIGQNITADNYVQGALEDWTTGALRLNGRDQYAKAQLPDDAEAQTKLEEAAEPVTVEDFDGWLTLTHPSAIIAGEEFEVTVDLNDQVPDDKIVQVFLGARKHRGWGGTHAMPKDPRGFKAGEAPKTIAMTPKDAAGLKEYVLVVHYADEPGWENHEEVARVTVPLVPSREVAGSGDYVTPQISTEPLLIEAYFQADSGSSGVIVEKMSDGVGYSLTIDDAGHAAFTAKSQGGESTEVRSPEPVTTGDWVHLIAELDREGKKATLYLNGNQAAQSTGLGPEADLKNSGELYLGGTPDGRNLAMTIDFLRICRGTLDLARTSIEELTAWQFQGPFLRDFTGAEPKGKGRDAGALELR